MSEQELLELIPGAVVDIQDDTLAWTFTDMGDDEVIYD